MTSTTRSGGTRRVRIPTLCLLGLVAACAGVPVPAVADAADAGSVRVPGSVVAASGPGAVPFPGAAGGAGGEVRAPLADSLYPDREKARGLAREELARPEYREQRPGLGERLVRWILDRLAHLPGPSTPASAWLLGVILVVLIALAALGLKITGGPRRVARGSRPDALFGEKITSALEHREAADRAASAQDWSTAVLERFRAIMRELEERAVLEPRPGRTADEASREAGVRLPTLLGALLTSARQFDDVRYGDHPATGRMDAELQELDASIRSARPVPLTGSPTSPAVPA
ncbi:MAG: hypothetical protein QG608_3269 [Actinomycetota bacterium]|nr:hypothetical protein [Actinomycetota bacterium]